MEEEGNVSCAANQVLPEVKHPHLGGLTLKGYEFLGFERVTSLPPQSCSHHNVRYTDHPVLASIPSYTERQVREILLDHVSRILCYGTQAARSMAFTSVEPHNLLQYTLESFMEKRETAWVWEPYSGGKVDGPSNGEPPLPWDVHVPSPDNWENHVQRTCVPHTEQIRTCHLCIGNRWSRCQRCSGRGGVHCCKCDGKGDISNRFQLEPQGRSRQTCCTCGGSGTLLCRQCHGKGRLACSECSGNGQVICYIELTVTWTNYSKKYVYNQVGLPSEVIVDEEMGLILEDIAGRLQPLNDFDCDTIRQISRDYLKEHAEAYTTERLVRQRQQVKAVPVTEVNYQWGDSNGSFYIYGFDGKVLFPQYPEKTLCGCVLL